MHQSSKAGQIPRRPFYELLRTGLAPLGQQGGGRARVAADRAAGTLSDQGADPWKYDREFAELFTKVAPEWRGVPRFEHLLFDQTRQSPESVPGAVAARLAQVALMAAFREAKRELLEKGHTADGELYRTVGFEEVANHVEYVLATQPDEHRATFVESLRGNVPGRGGQVMNYVEQWSNGAAGKDGGRVGWWVRFEPLRDSWDAMFRGPPSERPPGSTRSTFGSSSSNPTRRTTAPTTQCPEPVVAATGTSSSIKSPRSLMTTETSCLLWRFIQNSGPVPRYRPRRSAVSAEIARSPRNIDVMRFPGTRMASASWFALISLARSSSRSTTPGCVRTLATSHLPGTNPYDSPQSQRRARRRRQTER